MSAEERSTASLQPVMAVVFVIGFLMATYGLFFVVADGAVLRGVAWIAGGLLLEVASGALSQRKEEGRGLTNPFAVLTQAVRSIRNTVRGWDRRE